MAFYKKVEKKEENYYGVELLEGNENPLFKPCLISLAAQNFLKPNNGVMTQGMRFARVRSSEEDASRVLIQNMDVTFLTHEKSDGIDMEADMAPYISQILSMNPSEEELRRIFRNVNIVSYCDGDFKVNATIRRIRNMMEQNGYSLEEADDVLKNIVVFSFAKNSAIDSAVTSYTFLDVLDEEGSVMPPEFIEAVQQAKEQGRPDGICVLRDGNQCKICFSHDEEHTIKYMGKGEVIPSVVASLVTGAIENSRENSHSDGFIPYPQDESLHQVEEIVTRIQNGEKSNDIMAEIDKRVYQDLPHANEAELFLTGKIDTVSKILSKHALPDEDTRVSKYRQDKNRLVEAARRIFSAEQMEYILNEEEKEKQITNEKSFSPKGREVLEKIAQGLSDTYVDKEPINDSGKINLSFIEEPEVLAQTHQVEILKEMLDIRKSKEKEYNHQSEVLYQDMARMKKIMSRMVEIGSDEQLAQVFLKYRQNIFKQYSLPQEDQELVNQMRSKMERE